MFASGINRPISDSSSDLEGSLLKGLLTRRSRGRGHFAVRIYHPDIPTPTNYVDGLKPLLDQFCNQRELRIILFRLNESTYSRERAPLAGHYPCILLGEGRRGGFTTVPRE
jgi:hypothetical protein